MKKFVLIIAAILFLPSSSVNAQNFVDGIAAYSLQDYTRAHDIWLKLSHENDLESQFRLALLYELGRGVDQNDKEAHKWYTLSAEGGYPPAQLALANNFSIGRGVNEDNFQAFEWYLIAAENRVAKAQFHVGSLYVLGEVVGQNLIEAYYWISLSFLNFEEGTEQNRALILLEYIGKMMTGDELMNAKKKIDKYTVGQ